MTREWLALMCAAAFLFGCGDKVPASQAAKSVGEIPKQIVDKAAADTAKAVQQDAERNREAQ